MQDLEYRFRVLFFVFRCGVGSRVFSLLQGGRREELFDFVVFLGFFCC